MILSGGYFKVARDVNFDIVGSLDVDPLVNLEGTGVGKKLGIYKGKVPVI